MSSANTARQPGSHDHTQTVLMVGDEVIVRVPLREYLRECGLRVIEATNVKEAKAVLKANTPIDLVISDVSPPGPESGFALANWIRQNRPDVGLLLSSGAANAVEKAAELRLDGVLLTKPYEHGQLLRRVQDLLHKRSQRRNDRQGTR